VGDLDCVNRKGQMLIRKPVATIQCVSELSKFPLHVETRKVLRPSEVSELQRSKTDVFRSQTFLDRRYVLICFVLMRSDLYGNSLQGHLQRDT